MRNKKTKDLLAKEVKKRLAELELLLEEEFSDKNILSPKLTRKKTNNKDKTKTLVAS